MQTDDADRRLRDALEKTQSQLKVAEQKISALEAAAREQAQQTQERLQANVAPMEQQLHEAQKRLEALQHESQTALNSVRASWLREVHLRDKKSRDCRKC